MMHQNGTGLRVRVVATGEAGNGDSEVASDKEVAPVETPLLPGALFYSLWGADQAPPLPNDGNEPKFSSWFPPDGGFRYELIVLPPDGTQPPANLDKAAALAETEKVLPGLMQAMDPKHPGMHQTDTIDLIYVTEGACVLVLDGGDEVTLRAGDVLVQNGPRHAWRNPNAEPCGLLTVSIGVKRKS
ncbi:MAG: cupin domain-containing protein [Hyphomicrobiales bacterium]